MANVAIIKEENLLSNKWLLDIVEKVIKGKYELISKYPLS